MPPPVTIRIPLSSLSLERKKLLYIRNYHQPLPYSSVQIKGHTTHAERRTERRTANLVPVEVSSWQVRKTWNHVFSCPAKALQPPCIQSNGRTAILFENRRFPRRSACIVYPNLLGLSANLTVYCEPRASIMIRDQSQPQINRYHKMVPAVPKQLSFPLLACRFSRRTHHSPFFCFNFLINFSKTKCTRGRCCGCCFLRQHLLGVNIRVRGIVYAVQHTRKTTGRTKMCSCATCTSI